MSRTPAKVTQWRIREQKLMGGLLAGYQLVAEGERILAKHRGEMTTMTLADLISAGDE